jgi:hypothetical protein
MVSSFMQLKWKPTPSSPKKIKQKQKQKQKTKTKQINKQRQISQNKKKGKRYYVTFLDHLILLLLFYIRCNSQYTG